jgi:hypothetical protein
MYQESKIQNFSGHQLSKETLGSTHGRFYIDVESPLFTILLLEVPTE